MDRFRGSDLCCLSLYFQLWPLINFSVPERTKKMELMAGLRFQDYLSPPSLRSTNETPTNHSTCRSNPSVHRVKKRPLAWREDIDDALNEIQIRAVRRRADRRKRHFFTCSSLRFFVLSDRQSTNSHSVVQNGRYMRGN